MSESDLGFDPATRESVLAQMERVLEMQWRALIPPKKQEEPPKTTILMGKYSWDYERGKPTAQRPGPFTFHHGLAGNPHIDPAYLSKLPKHKDWDRRFQCGAVWADKNGREATVAEESPHDGCLKMRPAGDKSVSVYLPWRLEADFDFVRLDPPASRLGNIQGIGVSAEPPKPLACQDQYGDEDGL